MIKASSLSLPDFFNEGDGGVGAIIFFLGLKAVFFIGDLLFDFAVMLDFIVDVFMPQFLCYFYQ